MLFAHCCVTHPQHPADIAEKAAIAGRFLQRKMDEFEQMKAEIESLQQEAIGKVQF